MKVLVTNDDGIDAPGLHALARALVADGRDVVVVAPARDMSGSGAAIGQVHLDETSTPAGSSCRGCAGVPAYAVDGAPGLCVLAARLGGFGDPPDVVMSGINPGCNTGRAVLHSGTVGAALTAANFGVRGAGGQHRRGVRPASRSRGAVRVADGEAAVDGRGRHRARARSDGDGAGARHQRARRPGPVALPLGHGRPAAAARRSTG